MHIWGQKEATWNTIFSIFFDTAGPPNDGGPRKLFPSPSRRASLGQEYLASSKENKYACTMDPVLTLNFDLDLWKVNVGFFAHAVNICAKFRESWTCIFPETTASLTNERTNQPTNKQTKFKQARSQYTQGRIARNLCWVYESFWGSIKL